MAEINRIIFMGTPEFAVPTLQAMLDHGENVVAVVCQPDRPKGRGRKVQPPPVKILAESRGIPVLQPTKIRTQEYLDELAGYKPDLFVVTAYGRILPGTLLDLPPLGTINVHGSLLPKFRGAAPVQRAIIEGETVTGITIMQMDEGMDTGDILLPGSLEIDPDDTAITLAVKMSALGGELLVKALDLLRQDKLPPQKQDDSLATDAPMLAKDEAPIDWHKSANQISCQIRGLDPWPKARTNLGDKWLRPYLPQVLDGDVKEAPGTLARIDKEGLVIATGKGYLLVREIQFEGKKRMPVDAFCEAIPWRPVLSFLKSPHLRLEQHHLALPYFNSSQYKTMTIAYLDCFAGISGDMLLGSFVDAGLDLELLKKNFSLLPLAGYEVHQQKTTTNGLSATKVEITVQDGQPQRSYQDIQQLLHVSHLAEDIKENSLAVFAALAKAEATVHGVSLDDVHFHEVGAVDSILDIVGAAVAFSFFDVDSLICSPLPMGHGWVECEHGTLPLPAPAVVELSKGMEVYGVDLDQELVTPTGAAIVKALADGFGPLPSLTVSHTGYGAGSHILTDQRPNMLRLFVGEETEIIEAQEVEVIDCHLDDWAPETYPYLCDRLFDAQALDVSLIPIQMKKGRPGFLLRVLADNAHAHQCKRLILDETTAIGLRFRKERRWTLPRRAVTLKTRFGKMVVKEVDTPSGTRIYPEYEECCRLAEEQGVAIQQIYHEVLGHNAK